MKCTYGACTGKEEERAEGKEVSHEEGDDEEDGDEGDGEEGVVGLGRRRSNGRVLRVARVGCLAWLWD